MAHNLNLALNDSCSGVSQVANFYDVLEKLYNFFRSFRRWAMLDQTAIKMQPISKVALKRVLTTRWSNCGLYVHVTADGTGLQLVFTN